MAGPAALRWLLNTPPRHAEPCTSPLAGYRFNPARGRQCCFYGFAFPFTSTKHTQVGCWSMNLNSILNTHNWSFLKGFRRMCQNQNRNQNPHCWVDSYFPILELHWDSEVGDCPQFLLVPEEQQQSTNNTTKRNYAFEWGFLPPLKYHSLLSCQNFRSYFKKRQLYYNK